MPTNSDLAEEDFHRRNLSVLDTRDREGSADSTKAPVEKKAEPPKKDDTDKPDVGTWGRPTRTKK